MIFGTDTVHAEVARTSDERSRGLSHRDSVPAGTGMLFVYEQPEQRSFWMLDTYVPLDIAFIDPDLLVLDIQRMEARSTDFTESPAPFMFALEVPAGWFAEHGVAAGARPRLVFGPAPDAR